PEHLALRPRAAPAAAAAGKPWIMPAWSNEERRLSEQLGVDFMVVIDEFGALKWALTEAAKPV
ncbi:hypothetical protein, partial [Inquilinus sp. OTU3971]|uniref:hypothetical protein n=1 Tax=Inquilinus sp. OTU3971 TaxID=3043855 RepID=UPI00313C8C73